MVSPKMTKIPIRKLQTMMTELAVRVRKLQACNQMHILIATLQVTAKHRLHELRVDLDGEWGPHMQMLGELRVSSAIDMHVSTVCKMHVFVHV